jgi:hypothetical protein
MQHSKTVLAILQVFQALQDIYFRHYRIYISGTAGYIFQALQDIYCLASRFHSSFLCNHNSLLPKLDKRFDVGKFVHHHTIQIN